MTLEDAIKNYHDALSRPVIISSDDRLKIFHYVRTKGKITVDRFKKYLMNTFFVREHRTDEIITQLVEQGVIRIAELGNSEYIFGGTE